MKYIFQKDGWKKDDFVYAYSPACKEFPKFIQENDCIVNKEGLGLCGYQYISIITKAKYKKGVKVTTNCRYDKFGAPLIAFTNELWEKDGNVMYGAHFEVVAYEDGCNVWLIKPNPEGPRPTIVKKVGSLPFKLQDGCLVTITVEILDKKIAIDVNGNIFEVADEEIPDCCHVGITACEGINRFYDFEIIE